jgi:hypothetical protein
MVLVVTFANSTIQSFLYHYFLTSNHTSQYPSITLDIAMPTHMVDQVVVLLLMLISLLVVESN